MVKVLSMNIYIYCLSFYRWLATSSNGIQLNASYVFQSYTNIKYQNKNSIFLFVLGSLGDANKGGPL